MVGKEDEVGLEDGRPHEGGEDPDAGLGKDGWKVSDTGKQEQDLWQRYPMQ
jgi:hypothetical protein